MQTADDLQKYEEASKLTVSEQPIFYVKLRENNSSRERFTMLANSSRSSIHILMGGSKKQNMLPCGKTFARPAYGMESGHCSWAMEPQIAFTAKAYVEQIRNLLTSDI